MSKSLSPSTDPTFVHVCDKCRKTFSNKSHLTRHQKTHVNVITSYTCSICDKFFPRKDVLTRHMKSHDSEEYVCPKCPKTFVRKDMLTRHMATHNKSVKRSQSPTPRPSPTPKRQRPVKVSDVFSSRFIYPSPAMSEDLLKSLEEARPQITTALEEKLMLSGGLKWYAIVKARMSRKDASGEMEYASPYFRSLTVIDLDVTTIPQHIQEAFTKIDGSMEEFIQSGSDWILDRVLHIELKIADYRTLAGSSYIPLPSELKQKKALLNIQNEDQKCFLWSVLRALHPINWQNNASRVVKYQPYEQEINMDGIQYPAAQPEFYSFTEFDEDLFAVQRNRRTLTLCRSVQVGFTILDISKVLMYQFHYETMLNKYGSNAKLLFTDTDSLTYEISTPTLEQDLQSLKQHFDFSDYPDTHPLHDISNKKKIGFFKDELNGRHGLEFVGLRPKMYSLLEELGVKFAAKGISKVVAKQQLKHHVFLQCLKTGTYNSGAV